MRSPGKTGVLKALKRIRKLLKMIKTLASIGLYAYFIAAAVLPPVFAYGQVDESNARMGGLVGGFASKYCAPGVSHDIANAVEVFGRQLAQQLPVPSLIDIPGEEILPMEGTLSVRFGGTEISLYKHPSPDITDSLMWVSIGNKVEFSVVLKHELPASLTQCTVGGRNLAFVSTLDLEGNAYDLYIFDDAGRLVTSIKGKGRYNLPVVTVDEVGTFSIYGSGLSINGIPTWSSVHPAKNDPRLSRFLGRLNTASASRIWKQSLKNSLLESGNGSVHEIFFPRVFILRPDAHIVDASIEFQRKFYTNVAEQMSDEFMAKSDEHGIFTHDLTLPIFVRVLAEANAPAYARKKWNDLPGKVKKEIEFDLLIDFWRLKGVPEVSALFSAN
jgi:hypothetical protein